MARYIYLACPCHVMIHHHSQCSIAFHGPYLQLIEKLLPMMPHPSLDSFFFWNSGSEAVEAAIKMSRAVTRRQNIIAMQGMSRERCCCHVDRSTYLPGGYHGRTYGAMAVTKSKPVYSEGFGPLMVCSQFEAHSIRIQFSSPESLPYPIRIGISTPFYRRRVTKSWLEGPSTS